MAVIRTDARIMRTPAGNFLQTAVRTTAGAKRPTQSQRMTRVVLELQSLSVMIVMWHF